MIFLITSHHLSIYDHIIHNYSSEIYPIFINIFYVEIFNHSSTYLYIINSIEKILVTNFSYFL